MEYRLLAVTSHNRLGEILEGLHISDVEISYADSISQALQQLAANRIRFIALDFEALGSEAIPFLKRLHRISPLTDIVLFSEDSTFDELVIDCVIDKNLPNDQIHAEIIEAIDRRKLLDDAGMFGHSRSLRDSATRIKQVAPTDISVLVMGPSGTGKELITRSIHANSPRRNNEYISINCASIPENLLESELFGYEKGAFTGADRTQPGLLQQAHKGTLFLDEIGELHPHLQAKLLRAIDLSERPEDILPIVAHLMGRLKSKVHFSPEATELLLKYGWPGNVRELTNFLQRLLITAPQGEISRETVAALLDKHRVDDRSLPVVTGITAEESGYRLIYQALLNLANEVIDLKRLITERIDGHVRPTNEVAQASHDSGDLEAMEEKMIRDTLDRVDGNRKRAADILGIGERTLYRKLKKYNLT
ncbi:MAG: sigma-54-dependent Fis family transcriptional regulator [bacterium]|nr:sigma-54-dependent Fis family transcriptional regulator [bacterium]